MYSVKMPKESKTTYVPVVLKWSLCNQQHHEIRIQGIANYYVIVYVTEAKNDADVGVSMCI